ncbi:hypothetical protein QTJ16_006908 [Diplocarpon rosae]|uniref:DUF3835 domain-containing protein n=1 Tax=Diplocarpon rosae TaxID=946125 RepID=A0AAD9SUJ3_9HELO|nr:hypothetical protein QTJ16_006908 [Diplocarpon rosae]
MEHVKDSFLDLERHRQLLEENIEKLRKSMLHWQIWEAEYEGLKEEILAAKPSPTREGLLALSREYEGQLVTKKELEDILGAKEARTAAQVVNLLDRRIDYVEQNVRTIEKQIRTAEDKLAAASVISTPDVRNEEGLPLTEITEELDDEGNVISSRLSTPGSVKPQLLEALEKAGIKNLLPDSSTSDTPAPEIIAPANMETPVPGHAITQPKPSKPKKKGVKFTEDTKLGPELEKSQTAKRIEDIMRIAKEQESPPSDPPTIPTNEAPKDAALRREMLQYGISEVGAVVAELDIEEGSDWTDDGYDDTSSIDDEDAFGRSTGRLVNDKLRQEMLELEERLGIRAMQNVGRETDKYNVVDEGIGRIIVNSQTTTSCNDADHVSDSESIMSSSLPSTKKSVRFSEELDISPVAKPLNTSPPTKKQRSAAPVCDIIERNAPTRIGDPVPQKKLSQFKSARAASPNVLNDPLVSPRNEQNKSLSLHPATSLAPKPFSAPIAFRPTEGPNRTVPTGPEGKILAPMIVERDIPTSASTVEPDDLDPQLLHQEVATDYHKMRNKMIQRQGGFLKEEESEIVPFTEEEGGPKKVSRFKAARLSRS